jgi:hypothetical protein
MGEILRDTIQTAQKLYPCDACHQFDRSGYGQRDVSVDDWLIVQGVEADRWKITPGMQYRKVTYRDGGKLVTYRARLDMDALCQRNDLFDEC